VKCALLGWSAFKDAVLQAQGMESRTVEPQTGEPRGEQP
jgi:hypothetical protein